MNPITIELMPSSIAKRGVNLRAIVELSGIRRPLVIVCIGIPKKTSLSSKLGS